MYIQTFADMTSHTCVSEEVQCDSMEKQSVEIQACLNQ